MTSSARSNIVSGTFSFKRTRGLKIYGKLELCRLFDWQFGGLGPLHNSINDTSGAFVEIFETGSVGHQPAVLHKSSEP